MGEVDKPGSTGVDGLIEGDLVDDGVEKGFGLLENGVPLGKGAVFGIRVDDSQRVKEVEREGRSKVRDGLCQGINRRKKCFFDEICPRRELVGRESDVARPFVFCGTRMVDHPTGEVEEIALSQRVLCKGRVELGQLKVPRRKPSQIHRVWVRRSMERPVLAPIGLEDKHVHIIVVGSKPLRPGRGDVHVGAHGGSPQVLHPRHKRQKIARKDLWMDKTERTPKILIRRSERRRIRLFSFHSSHRRIAFSSRRIHTRHIQVLPVDHLPRVGRNNVQHPVQVEPRGESRRVKVGSVGMARHKQVGRGIDVGQKGRRREASQPLENAGAVFARVGRQGRRVGVRIRHCAWCGGGGVVWGGDECVREIG